MTQLPKIVLTAVDHGLVEAWTQFCGDLQNVSIHHGSILDVWCDAVVSPANSFGYMDGGVDLVYSEYFGSNLQEALKNAIEEYFDGELPVGFATIVETQDSDIPYMIAAPTMRLPMRLDSSINVYLATTAVLKLVSDGLFIHGDQEGERISDYVKVVAFPGMGTGVGGLRPEDCAREVRRAIEDLSI